MGAQASVLGNHQIAVLDASTEEADGPGCTVANHCYYGHKVGASSGKSSCHASWFIHPRKAKGKV